MDTFEVKRDVVYDGDTEWIILDAEALKTLKGNIAKELDKATRDMLKVQATWLESERERLKDKIKSVTVTVQKPTPFLRTEVQSACRDAKGEYIPSRIGLESCQQLVISWTLPVDCTPANIVNGTMPMCLFDAVVAEIYVRMFPSESRLAFFGQ